MNTIRVLTLTQPWATLVAIGAKRFETRSWPVPSTLDFPFRLAIHAAKGPGKYEKQWLRELCHAGQFGLVLRNVKGYYHGYGFWDSLPAGEILAMVDVVDCQRTENVKVTERESDFGDYTPGRYAWKLENVRRLRQPLPARGAQGLWTHEWAPIEALLEG